VSPATLSLPTPVDVGQDVADNDLEHVSDYSNTDSVAMDREEYGTINLSDDNFVQNFESLIEDASELQADSSAPTEPNVQQNQASWSLTPSNVSLKTNHNDVTTTESASLYASSHTSNYKISVAEVAHFSAQGDALQSTEMFTDIYTTTEDILRNAETPSSEQSDATTNTELNSEEQTTTTITETSVTAVPVQTQDEIPSADSGVQSSGDTGDTYSDRPEIYDKVTGSSSSSTEATGGLGETLRNREIGKAHPSAVRAETEIVVHDSKTRLRSVGVHSVDVITEESVTQTTYATELFVNSERKTADDVGEVTKTMGPREDTATETYPAVSGAEKTVALFVDDMATTSLGPVSEGTAVNGEEDPLGTETLQEYNADSTVRVATSKPSDLETEPSGSVLPTELDNSLLDLAMATLASALSKDEDTGTVTSGSVSTGDTQIPEKEPHTATESYAQTTYEDSAETGERTTYSKWGTTGSPDTPPQSSSSESAIYDNVMKIPEAINEIFVTFPPTDMSGHETMTSVLGQPVTSPEEDHDTDTITENLPETSSAPSHGNSDKFSVVPAWREQENVADPAASVVPRTNEGTNAGKKPTNEEESTTEHFQSTEFSELHEIIVSLQSDVKEAVDISVQTEQLSNSETVTQHVESFGTQQLDEVTTEFLQSETKTTSETWPAISESETGEPSSSAVSAAENLPRSGTHKQSQTPAFLEKGSAPFDNFQNVTESIPKSTIIHSEIVVISEGTIMLPVEFSSVGSSSPSSTVDISDLSSTEGSPTTPNVTAPSAGATNQQSSENSPVCGFETSDKLHGTECWLVRFLSPDSTSSSVCLGSYLDSNTILTSANCVSRLEEFERSYSVT
jgi:hypothetical protein